MSEDIIRFETPENIAVEYFLAGPGTRYAAHVVDSLVNLLGFIVLGIFIVSMIVALGAAQVVLPSPEDSSLVAAALVGMVIIVVGFSTIGYYALFEYFMSGQTPGKRLLRIRVVMDQGFTLTFSAVMLRSVFRILDHTPFLWIVPLSSAKNQRLGDLVAGTLVISEAPSRLHAVRAQLASRSLQDRLFAFTPVQLQAVTQLDLAAAETFLDRRWKLEESQRTEMARRLAQAVSIRVDDAPPSQYDQERYLEDLVTTYVHKEARELA